DEVGDRVQALALVGAGGAGELVELLGGVEGEDLADLVGGGGPDAGVQGEHAAGGEAVLWVHDHAEEREDVAHVRGAGEARAAVRLERHAFPEQGGLQGDVEVARAVEDGDL